VLAPRRLLSRGRRPSRGRIPLSLVVALSLTLVAASLLTACSSSVVSRGPGERSSGRPHPPTTVIPATSSTLRLATGSTTIAITRSAPTSTTRAENSPPAGTAAEDAVIAKAWLAELTAYYQASEHDDPSLPAMLAGAVPGSAEFAQVTAFIDEQRADGVAGPSHWRIGDVRVVSREGSRAVVTGCSYDKGSYVVSTGAVAPTSLGGGAGLTSYSSVMERSGGTWKVDSTAVAMPKSPAAAGPCHGF